jgi:hypothetical protein
LGHNIVAFINRRTKPKFYENSTRNKTNLQSHFLIWSCFEILHLKYDSDVICLCSDLSHGYSNIKFSDLLCWPNYICRQAKDALKILKKRLGSKNPKTQLLALFVSLIFFFSWIIFIISSTWILWVKEK